MAHAKFILLVVVAASIGVLAWVTKSGLLEKQWAKWTKGAPLMDCPSTIELGQQEIGTLAVGRLNVANCGRSALVIDKIRRSCLCIGVGRERDGELTPLESFRLDPGERVQLTVHLRVAGRPGAPSSNHLILSCNDPTQPQRIVEIHIPKLQGGITALPATLLVGTVPQKCEVRRVVEVYDACQRPRGLGKAIAPETGRFSVRLLPMSPAGPNAQPQNRDIGVLVGRLEITVNTEQPGPVEGEVEVYLPNASGPVATIRVCGRIAPPVEMVPASLVLPRQAKGGALYRARCLCRARDGKNLDLSLEQVPPGLAVEIQPVLGNSSCRWAQVQWIQHKNGNHDLALVRKVRLRAKVGDEVTVLELPVICQHTAD